jgi:uncharacterized protein YbaR (Trm112 family)
MKTMFTTRLICDSCENPLEYIAEYDNKQDLMTIRVKQCVYCYNKQEIVCNDCGHVLRIRDRNQSINEYTVYPCEHCEKED